MQSLTRPILTALAVVALGSSATLAGDRQDVRRGKAFAETYCAACHATGLFGGSPIEDAPPFRTLAQRYPLDDLAEPLAEGIQTGHPLMPEWHIDPQDVHDLLAYMKSIQAPAPR